MNSRTEIFIRTFEEIVTEVNHRARASSSHSFEIEKATERDATMRENVRNLHPPTDDRLRLCPQVIENGRFVEHAYDRAAWPHILPHSYGHSGALFDVRRTHGGVA